MRSPLLVRWAVINSVFVTCLLAARFSYHGHIHLAGEIAVAAVLCVYAAGSALAAVAAYRTDHGHPPSQRRLGDLAETVDMCPKIAMLGMVAGFLIALSGSQSDLQNRLAGASTGLAATFTGITCMLVLGIQLRMLVRHAEE